MQKMCVNNEKKYERKCIFRKVRMETNNYECKVEIKDENEEGIQKLRKIKRQKEFEKRSLVITEKRKSDVERIKQIYECKRKKVMKDRIIVLLERKKERKSLKRKKRKE